MDCVGVDCALFCDHCAPCRVALGRSLTLRLADQTLTGEGLRQKGCVPQEPMAFFFVVCFFPNKIFSFRVKRRQKRMTKNLRTILTNILLPTPSFAATIPSRPLEAGFCAAAMPSTARNMPSTTPAGHFPPGGCFLFSHNRREAYGRRKSQWGSPPRFITAQGFISDATQQAPP